MLNLGSVINNLGLSDTLKTSLNQLFSSGDKRAAFIAVLTATAANASKKPNFNLELEINDLWTRLGNLRDAGGGAGMSPIQSQIQNIVPQLTRILESLGKPNSR